ncbi:hypothetical protein EDB80DRAFT_690114 [Ilyonectria destructans]|nr:hypothetical protein EDB80DRAFT_690114 [Ilyonectria destructans]
MAIYFQIIDSAIVSIILVCCLVYHCWKHEARQQWLAFTIASIVILLGIFILPKVVTLDAALREQFLKLWKGLCLWSLNVIEVDAVKMVSRGGVENAVHGSTEHAQVDDPSSQVENSSGSTDHDVRQSMTGSTTVLIDPSTQPVHKPMV